jgi:ubiquinone/menaquinone biosynthesis C-methylase UbiE
MAVNLGLRLYRFLFAGPAPVRRFQSRHAYQLMSRNMAAHVPSEPGERASDPFVVASSFLNYGYEPLTEDAGRPALEAHHEARRQSIQLYAEVVAGLNLANADVLEVGSGRGGGAAFMAEYLGPRSVTGLELAAAAVEFSRRAHARPGLTFQQGDAEAMPFADASFDIVVNVESSHCYGSMDRFLGEVTRVLRPGGCFAWADARFPADVPPLDEAFARTPLVLVDAREITANVLRALEVTSDAKNETIDAHVPGVARGLARSAMAVRGTLVFRALESRSLVYLRRQCRKPAG